MVDQVLGVRGDSVLLEPGAGLRSRGFDIPKEVEQRIAECADPVLLVSWLSRAATIADVSELLAG